MGKLFITFIIASGFMLLASVAYAADVDDTAGATVQATAINTLSITSGAMSITAPTGVGPSTTTLTGSPVYLYMVDNNFNMGGQILNAKISSSIPAQYGTSNTYYLLIASDGASFSELSDSDIDGTEVEFNSGVQLSASDQGVMSIYGDSTSTEYILRGTYALPVQLVINSGKRIRGDTSDSITIQFTFTDQ
jgi:hypothetical protein